MHPRQIAIGSEMRAMVFSERSRCLRMGVLFLCFCHLVFLANGQTSAGDKAALSEFIKTFGETGTLPLSEEYCSPSFKGIVSCDRSGSITDIQMADFSYGGTLTASLGKLSQLRVLRLQNSGLKGDIPAELGNLVNLKDLRLSQNVGLGVFPEKFFTNLTSLTVLFIGDNGATTFAGDVFPSELGRATELMVLNVQNSNIGGAIPAVIGTLTKLTNVTLSYNNFNSFPEIFVTSLLGLLSLRVNNNMMLTGAIPAGIGTMLENVSEVWLHVCNFTGTLPDSFSKLENLQSLKLSDNYFLTGVPPPIKAGAIVDLHSTLFIGPMPSYLENSEFLQQTYFCSKRGPCDSVTTALIEFMKDLNYPLSLLTANPSWRGSFSCELATWAKLTCNDQGDLEQIILPSSGLSGSISPYLANITTLTKIDLRNNMLSKEIPDLSRLQALRQLYLQNNKLTGAVPDGLTKIPTLSMVNVSSNLLTAIPTPTFPPSTQFIYADNRIGAPTAAPQPGLGTPVGPPNKAPSPTPLRPINSPTISPAPTSPGNAPVTAPSGSQLAANSTPPPPGGNTSPSSNQGSAILPVVGGVVGGLAFLIFVGVMCCFFVIGGRKKQTSQVQSPGVYESFQGEDAESLKSEGSRASKKSYLSNRPTAHTVMTMGSVGTHHRSPSDVGSVMSVESTMDRNPLFLPPGQNMSFPLQLIQEATDNFSEANILGRGGFGTVYRGQFPDGMMIAVKRMEMVGLTARGQAEFDAEIMVLTRVRHRHLVALLGFCVSGSERLLIYEYMSQGPLSRHIFDHRRYHLTPLNWKTRVSVALDVARGMEYLHGLTQSSFIHRDLKPSNVLIDNDYRAKVADFGLVKLAPSGFSVETRLAGTFGYLAPEYAATGRVTTKSDVYSYGVMLMELITGRKALDERQSEDDMHLVTWLVPMIRDRAKLRQVVDATLDMEDEESWDALCKVADLAAQCTLRDPHQRPQMDNCVGLLMPLVRVWQPDRLLDDDSEAIDPAIQASALRPWDRNGWDATDTFDPPNLFPDDHLQGR
eukprot:TRINITY_DN405_c0_g1_i3.p1 TRINITY_DN405_c0_g1~~TRINITY_DN405_c0_g1_i3.p1  ORF type:complete len:1035 (-),score=168.02 TRINITY_DN405_c0_g1_i3:1143-4247(-)